MVMILMLRNLRSAALVAGLLPLAILFTFVAMKQFGVDANIVALCDVDMGAAHTLEVMEMFPDVPRFQDFRKMFDEMSDKIEAVSVGTPDFSHFPISMLAMSQGKHVYVEKPLAHNIYEVRSLMKAARENEVQHQHGNDRQGQGSKYGVPIGDVLTHKLLHAQGNGLGLLTGGED